jgi:hypothetical protein
VLGSAQGGVEGGVGQIGCTSHMEIKTKHRFCRYGYIKHLMLFTLQLISAYDKQIKFKKYKNSDF